MAPSKLDLHSLIVFYYVASEQSITAAADKLCLTQPTVTYHIRSLERNVGLKLLDVKKQKVFLTQAGEGLYHYVTEIYHQMNGAEKYLDNLKQDSLRVGISTTFSTCLASAAAAFEKNNSHVRLVIRGASSFEIAEAVLNSEIDLGIVVSAEYGNPKLKCIPLSQQEQLVLVASPSSAIAQRPHLAFVNLCGYPLILGPETSATRRIILKRLRTGGCHMPSPIVVEVNSSEWGINLVEKGEGVGLHHIRSVEKPIAEGRLKILPLSGDIYVGVEALLRADAPRHPMAEKFIALVRQELENKQNKTPVSASMN
ncbi:MAG: LysR family transcriptional regulator [Dehalococcoidales bacterium]|jgi:DNA-binding transcriptional LysR family regulator